MAIGARITDVQKVFKDLFDLPDLATDGSQFDRLLEDGEVVTAIEFPIPKKSGYAKFPNPASRYAMVGVFAADTAEGPRVAVGQPVNVVEPIQDPEQGCDGNRKWMRWGSTPLRSLKLPLRNAHTRSMLRQVLAR